MDPVDLIWLRLAARLGLRVRRSSEVFASTDGQGELQIGAGPTLDSDDCLGQMIFHEVCHWLVQGRDAYEEADWGLDNLTETDVVREQACLRVQAYLLREVGLEGVFAPTTDFRRYYDACVHAPLVPAESEAVALACAAVERAGQEPWEPHLRAALRATADIARVLSRNRTETGESDEGGPVLWDLMRSDAADEP